MSNLPSKMYVVHSGDLRLWVLFSSKRKMFESMFDWDGWRPWSVHTYETFSQILRLNRILRYPTSNGEIVIRVLIPNCDEQFSIARVISRTHPRSL